MNIGLIGRAVENMHFVRKYMSQIYLEKFFAFLEDAGTADFAQNIDVDILNFKKLLRLIKLNKIDLVVVGPEEPLVKGVVNFLKKHKIKVFGPNRFASKLEGSKAFMKKICQSYKIPTAKFKICRNEKQLIKFINFTSFPIVVKADGLASGKGVTICKTKKQAVKISNQIFRGKFKSSNKIVVEEFLDGEEASYFLIVDKHNFKFFGTAQDHKRVGEKDRGRNTGGMGAYSPAPIINSNLEKRS